MPRSVPMLPSAGSWRAEYERLCDHTPVLLCEELNEHSDEVWHVSFSHNGRMFATGAKDGGVAVRHLAAYFFMRVFIFLGFAVLCFFLFAFLLVFFFSWGLFGVFI